MYFRPSQWLAFLIANVVSRIRTVLPAFRQWGWYIFRRAFLLCFAKYAIDNFWLCFKKRKLGVTYMRELSLMNWVSPNYNYKMDADMKVLIRKCGYHYNHAGVTLGKKVQPWFYGDVKDDTAEILEKMETITHKKYFHDVRTQSEDIQAVLRVLKNFTHFTIPEIMAFFKVSNLVQMEKGDVIFGHDDTIEYYYGVVSGEIHLFGEDETENVELLKVVTYEDCIVSILGFLRYFIHGPEKYETIKMHAICGKSGKYYRIPIASIKDYMEADKKKMYEITSSILIRNLKVETSLNDLTGIFPRLLIDDFLHPTYEEIKLEPGIITGTKAAEDVFNGLDQIFPVKKEDRKLCWVGVLDSRTIVLRIFKETKYAYYIHKGLLSCTISKLRRSYNSVQFYVTSGQIVGWREAVVGLELSVQYQVADGSKVIVAAIPGYLIRKYIAEDPYTAIKPIKKSLARHSLLSKQLWYTFRFSYKKPNESIYRKTFLDKDSETFAYLCLLGRLRFTFEKDPRSKQRVMGQYGLIEEGDWFGLVPMYSDDPLLHHTITCDRYSEYMALPRLVLAYITRKFREAAGYQCDYLAKVLHRDHEHTSLDTDKMLDTRFQVSYFGSHSWRTYQMICIYPTTEDIPADIYCSELARHHSSSAIVITREDALKALAVNEFTYDTEYSLAKWLVIQEEKTTLLLVLAVANDKLWNETIANLCDMVHILVTYLTPHKPSKMEENIIEHATKARKELVFIHPVIRITKPQVGPTRFPFLPKGSILWLKPRSWVQRHHHVRMLDSALRYGKLKNPEDLEKYIKESKDPDKHSDYARVVRWISGQSVGIVLGGGGAKGAAHLGALRYLHELDVPVDYIAGVSIGSFLGALYAVFENIGIVETKARELWEELKHPTRYARDLQYHPLSALTRGHAFNWMIKYFFEGIQIEDLYIPYFCVTSDLNDNCSRTHMSGDLWFYVRASCSLTGLVPPQINQFDYHLLMDGGYSDLVPAMTMRKMGIKYLVAINIGDERQINTFNIGYHVSGLKCAIQSLLLPFSIYNIPDHFDMWDALLYCSARNFLQILKAMDEYCIYIRPNINAYSGMDFQNFEEILTLGYLSTKFKFGSLKLKNLPVHVIWYLLRFYTYPNIPQSQAQLLQGFTDEDWEFAVNLMSKTQMFQRAKTTFLKMNLTPYLTDLMEARSYIESMLKQEQLVRFNLHVPVLENFSRDDERLDLVHAIARLKEWTYMQDIESILEKSQQQGGKADLKIKTKILEAASQTFDLINAKSMLPGPDYDYGFMGGGLFVGETEDEEQEESNESMKGTYYGVRGKLKTDAALHLGAVSFHNLSTKARMGRDLITNKDENKRKTKLISRFGIDYHPVDVDPEGYETKNKRKTKQSRVTFANVRKSTQDQIITEPKPTSFGQRLEDFRKMQTRADKIGISEDASDRINMVPILTLKQLRKTFSVNL